jgi:hypothetical protein
MDVFAKRQIPFAMATALTDVARQVQAAETKALAEVFDHPTPFTQRAFAVTPARKSNLVAVVFAKDIQKAYLSPFGEHGSGRQIVGPNRQGIPVPKDLRVNQYGNLPKGKIKALLAKPGVFSGKVETKSGEVISGVWQRVAPQAAGGRRRGAPRQAGLKLLIRWSDGAPVHQRFGFNARAEAIVRANMRAALASAWAKALATARR